MNRLFIHLFIVIVIGLLAINWLSEYLWQQWQPSQTSEHHILAQTLTKLTQQSLANQQTLQEIQKNLSFPVSKINYTDVAWLNSQKHALNKGEPVIGYDNNDNIIIYIQDNNSDNIYVFGPIEKHLTHQNISSIKYTLLLFSYLLLGVIIYLWSKPLWQDLNRLNHMATQIARGDFNIKPLAKVHSPIANIVTTFNLMAKQIIKLISDQRQLVNDVSHELRTPLARLRFAIEMLDNVSDKQRLAMTQDLSEMSSLIDEMLRYARLENLNAHTSKTETNMAMLIQNTLNKCTRNTAISVHCNIPPQCTFLCNEKMIERAIENLLSNALRYANQQININLSFKGKQLVLCVEDDGEGIEEKEQTKVFDAFYRIEKSRNKDLGGFGLGLAIVNRICLWHNGYCQLSHSALGGCRFCLFFPIDN